MKRICILLTTLLAAAACRQAEDHRYFAPSVEFGSATYAADAGEGGVDIDLALSRPASQELVIGLSVSGSLQEGTQFSLGDHSVTVPAGGQAARLHVRLVDDEIWDENAWIDLFLRPGERYTVDPQRNCAARILVSKVLTGPRLRLVAPGEPIVTNPYLAESFPFELIADRAPEQDIPVSFSFGNLSYGKDYRFAGCDSPVVTIPAGSTRQAFELQILKKDESGYDRTVDLSIAPAKGAYSVAGGEGTAAIHLYDPVVNFSRIWKTTAPREGSGYQFRLYISDGADGWVDNTNGTFTTNLADMGLSSEGSNYLRTYRNLYMHSSFNCLCNASTSQMFRLNDFFPNYLYPNATAILDYGTDMGHREFSPADSLMRFVLDKDATDRGMILLDKPRVFVARIGDREAWDSSASGERAWVKDSKETGGDILASVHPALQGTISVTLEKLEGRFDFSDTQAPILVTAWLRSDSDQFMMADTANGKDPRATFGVVHEADGTWKVAYKFVPR